MTNKFFSQYLLNAGIITTDNAAAILAESLQVSPQLYMTALQMGYLDGRQAAELKEADSFERAALDKEYLTVMQLDAVKKAEPDRDAFVAQVVFDQGLVDLPQLGEFFASSQKQDCHPVYEVMRQVYAASNLEETELGYIGDYMELFVSTLQRFMKADAVLVAAPAEQLEKQYLTYQSMGGAMALTVGCSMSPEIMVEMAARYSNEALDDVNEMTIDSVEEFYNVLNGLYIVNMSGSNLDMDLDMPYTVMDLLPKGGQIYTVNVVTDFGRFALYLSNDGFMF